jgi:hypothetical protein
MHQIFMFFWPVTLCTIRYLILCAENIYVHNHKQLHLFQTGRREDIPVFINCCIASAGEHINYIDKEVFYLLLGYNAV